MSEIAYIENLIKENEEYLKKCERLALESFAYSLIVESTKKHLQALTLQLNNAYNLREKEVVELRFIGPWFEFGSFPIEAMAEISRYVGQTVSKIFEWKRFGRVERRTKEMINQAKDALNLRVAGLGIGSSKIFLTASSAADMMERRLSVEALDVLFQVLRSKNQNELASIVSEIGGAGVNDLNKLLQTLNKNHAELEISWNSPQNENEKWKGTKDRIQNLSIQLSELVTQEMPTVTLEAEVYALSKGGRLELKPRGQKRVVVYYSINLYEKIQRLSIGEYRTFSIKPFVSSNAASGITKESYQLIEIN